MSLSLALRASVLGTAPFSRFASFGAPAGGCLYRPIASLLEAPTPLRPLARPFWCSYGPGVRTRPGICQRKRRYETREEAEGVALRAEVTLRAYKCALCGQFHLTSRTKGLRVPRTV